MCAHFQVFSRRPGHLRLIYTIVQVLSHGLLYVYFGHCQTMRVSQKKIYRYV